MITQHQIALADAMGLGLSPFDPMATFFTGRSEWWTYLVALGLVGGGAGIGYTKYKTGKAAAVGAGVGAGTSLVAMFILGAFYAN